MPWTNLTVRDAQKTTILVNGNGTRARSRLTVTGGWDQHRLPQAGQKYQIVSSEHGTFELPCVGYDNGEATFDFR